MSSAIRHILCGIDGTAPACRAGERAAGLALALGAELTYLAVAHSASPDAAIDAYMKTEGIEGEPVPLLAANAESCLAAALRSASERGHSGARGMVRVGKVSSTLISVASEIGADTIIIGRHRRSGIRRAVVGSVSRQIADQTAHTVILVS